MGRDFDAFAERDGLTFQGEDRLLDLPRPALAGAHQFDNVGLAVAAILQLARSAHRRRRHRRKGLAIRHPARPPATHHRTGAWPSARARKPSTPT